MYYGREGYVDCTRKIVSTTRKISEGLRKIKGIKIVGSPDVSVVAIGNVSCQVLIYFFFC